MTTAAEARTETQKDAAYDHYFGEIDLLRRLSAFRDI